MNSSTAQTQVDSEYRANQGALMQVPLFAGLAPEPRKLLAYLCTRARFRPGEVIFREGDMEGAAYILLEGTATLTVARGGNEEPLRVLGEGEFIGGLSLLADMKRLFSLTASSPVTCLMLSGEKFRKTGEQYPEIYRDVVEAIALAIGTWEVRLMDALIRQGSQCIKFLGASLL